MDRTLRYRPLANGWASHQAGIFLQNEGKLLGKMRQSIADDLNHGRFRPAFTLYVSLPYALSPLAHGRSMTEEGRPYDKLSTGDLRLFSFILLGTVAASLILMSLLIHSYTGEIVFSLIPAFFIPLSPALTENLLQNYIDSQEIPMLLWLCGWIFFFFIALKQEKFFIRTSCFAASFFFLLLSFLAKETAVILSVAIPAAAAAAWLFSGKKENWIPFITCSLLAICCSGAVYLIVSSHTKGYATSYSALNPAEIQDALQRLWTGLTKYTLSNKIYGWLPVGFFFILAFISRKKTLNGIPVSKHVALLALLLLLSCGFLLILVPWRPILIKYILPSIFFYLFAVALSLSFTAAWLKERYGKAGYLFLLILPCYAIPFKGYYPSACRERDYWADQANYGVAAADQLAGSIDRTLKRNAEENQAVFVEYGAEVPWGKLHLMRILNLDKKFNLLDASGKEILNYQMPKAELTSFRQHKQGRHLYLSDEKNDLTARPFDAVYKVGKMKEKPAAEFAVQAQETSLCYRMTGERIDWEGKSKSFPAFSLHEYLPFECASEKAAD
ncbi:hypothetical protein VU06_01935 [Desulfobulbus sp. F3]|nr:hypothetical protein [Desulfobulbus sp. F3]